MAHDVFLSYATEDKAVADAICASLEASRIRCWIAPRDILSGTDYPEAIVTAIGSSRITVLVYSAHANRSPHILRGRVACFRRSLATSSNQESARRKHAAV